jgi:hypothetical protein
MSENRFFCAINSNIYIGIIWNLLCFGVGGARSLPAPWFRHWTQGIHACTVDWNSLSMQVSLGFITYATMRTEFDETLFLSLNKYLAT